MQFFLTKMGGGGNFFLIAPKTIITLPRVGIGENFGVSNFCRLEREAVVTFVG